MAIRRATSAFTRPNDTTAYASGDLVANSTTAGSVTPLQFDFRTTQGPRAIAFREAIILGSNNGVTNKALRLHLFSVIPTFTSAGDNSALSSVLQGFANYIGSFDITAMTGSQDGSFGIGAPLANAEVLWQLPPGGASGNTSVYGVLEARGAYTPTAQEVFTVALSGYEIGADA